MKFCWLLLVTFLRSIPSAWTYASGPPSSICNSMTPSAGAHGSPSTSTVPYQLVPAKTSVKSGEAVTLSLEKISSATSNFIGFMVEALDLTTNAIVGSFSSSSTVYPVTCGSSNAAGHSSGSGKQSVTLTWTAPVVDSTRALKFVFTVMQSRSTHWVKKDATSQLTIEPLAAATQTSTQASTRTSTQASTQTSTKTSTQASTQTSTKTSTQTSTKTSTTTSTTTEMPSTVIAENPPTSSEAMSTVSEGLATNSVTEESGLTMSEVQSANYNGCALNKGCFGSEENCIIKGTCKLMFSYQYLSKTKSFQMIMHGNQIGAGEYISVGISTDNLMGSDLVFFCSNGATGINIAWNEGKDNLNGVTGLNIGNVDVKTVNSITTCSFTVDETLNPVLSPASQVSSQMFDLATSKYFILMASGPTSNGILTYHSMKTQSSTPIDLTSASLVAGTSSAWAIQVHGLLMIFAWLACASSGMLMARYYKQTWKSVKPLGKDFWFRCHQGFMGLAFLLTLAAFFIILASLKVVPFNPKALAKNPHAIVGIICILLTVIQPIMAYFRPHPGTNNRWIFNRIHWFVGNSAFIFAVAAIFLSINLPATKLPISMTHALIGYVGVHTLAHLVLTMQRDHEAVQPDDVKDFKDLDDGCEGCGSWVRKVIAVIYFAFVWTFAVAFVIVIISI